MELTVESLIAELGLELSSGQGSAKAHVRWVHITELVDPTPWLKGGELLLTTGIQLTGPKVQHELIERLAEHEIAGLGFGTGFAHKKLPVALVNAARKRGFPVFEVPYELPFIAITERVFAQLVDERYEMLQRSMAGDVLAEALTGNLYPEELLGKLRPFGIGEQAAVLAFAMSDPAIGAPLLERALQRAGVHSLVAIRAGLLCAVIDIDGVEPDPVELAGRARTELAARLGDVRAAASRPAATHSLRLSFHEARCALEAARLRNGETGDAIASYRDLGAFQLLLSLQDDDALMSYCRGVLGPVEQGEGEYGDELLRSLDVFIENNGHWERAASALYCHRHTLRYRIRRVEQLTGRDFSRARDRIEFWLALRGRELAR
ncbi:MAG TPA: PucR family transcriptional regulator ligand-binding domain-containing protein [Solirubrobacteraceae bacterium]|jgi:purine catabolism regulator|nr:PucR family transcriptional regulator ligand-binding domain-containing protein [Solirubrobacteraceae bacterium]